MARTFVVRLMAIKKSIYAEQHRIETQQAELQQKREELETQKSELDEQQASIVAQIDRANRYAVYHAREALLTCVRCFIVDGVLQNMLPIKAKISGIKRYGCKQCGEELNGDDLVVTT